MLTVIREMAEESERKEHRRVVPNDLLRAVLSAGEQSVARTPELLDILRNAGVVDAGGAGLVEIARGMVYGATGQDIPEAPVETESLGFDAIHSSSPSFATAPCSSSRATSSTRTRSRRSSSGSATRSSSSATPPRSRCTSTRTTREGPRIRYRGRRRRGRRDREHASPDCTARGTAPRGKCADRDRNARDRLVAVCPGRGNRRLFEASARRG